MRFHRIPPLRPQPTLPVRSHVAIGAGHRRTRRTISVAGIEARILADPLQASSGGDVYSIAINASGSRSRFLLADVAGHGESAQPLARQLCDLIARLAEITDCVQLSRALNRAFARTTADHEFATALVATYSRHSHLLSVCNAGHPRPLLYRARLDDWQLLGQRVRGRRPRNLPFGILAESEYTATSVRLDRGDLVLLYTDALSDAQAPTGRELGEEGMLDIVHSLGRPRMSRLPRELIGAVDRYRGGEPRDDQTVMLLHRSSWTPMLVPARSAPRAIFQFGARSLLRG